MVIGNPLNNRLIIIANSLIVSSITIAIVLVLYIYFTGAPHLQSIFAPIFGVLFDIFTWNFGLKLPAPEGDARYGSFLNRPDLDELIFLPGTLFFKIVYLCLYVKAYRSKRGKKLALLMMILTFWSCVINFRTGFNSYVYFLSAGGYFFALYSIGVFLFILGSLIVTLQLAAQYFKHYISVQDTASRKEFWLINTVFLVLIMCTNHMTWDAHNNSSYASLFGVLILLIYPSISLDCRRCNNLKVSRRIVFLRLIPIISILQFLYLGLFNSKPFDRETLRLQTQQ